MSEPSTAPRMVGRDAELGILLDALAVGAHGDSRAVIIRGEAGIGKTRLIREFLSAATGGDSDQLPVVVATGQCVDLGSIGAPFTPIRRMLHELHTGVGDEAFRAAAGGTATLATIGTLVPEVGADAPATTGGGASHVAEAIERLLEELSADVHLVLVLEDLHWADTATMDLLKTLAATLRGSHLTLVATYRTDNVGRGHPLRAVVAELERSRTVSFIDVARMDIDGVTALAQELGGGTLTADQIDKVLARSEGVPFFVEELIRLRDQPLPPTLRDVVLARYEQLSGVAKQAVGVAAVGGVHIDDETLQQAWPDDPAELSRALREAITDGIVTSDGDGYTFRHALIREAVYDDLLPQERATAQRAIATILQERVDGGETELAGAVAEHWLAVHDAARAFDATVVARTRARADFAPETAARLGERLLEMWPQVDDAEDRAGAFPAAVAAQIANDYVNALRNHDALRVAESGLVSAPDDAVLDKARLHLAAVEAVYHDTGMTGMTGVAHLGSIEDLLTGIADSVARGVLARARAMMACEAPGRDEKLALANSALDLAESIDDADTLAQVLRRRAMVLQQSGDPEGSLADTRRSLDLAPVGSIPRLIGFINMCDTLRVMGRFVESINVGSEGLTEAVDSGQERGYGAALHINLADTLISAGRVDEGLAHARLAATLLRGESARWLAIAASLEASVDVWADDLAAYEDMLQAIAPVRSVLTGLMEDTVWWQILALDAATARAMDAQGGERATSITTALALATSLFSNEIDEHTEKCRAWLVSACRAQATLTRLGEAPDPRLEARLHEIQKIVESDAVGEPYALVGDAFVREAASETGALDAWRAAMSLIETEPVRVAVPRRLEHEARYRLALALADAGEKADAVALLRRVVDEAPSHGIALVARWAREALARLGANSTPTSGSLEGLTPRELEVLALVAEGLTNRDIGARLFMSPKTASVHVSAILAKLGASNRTEAATLYTTRRARDPD